MSKKKGKQGGAAQKRRKENRLAHKQQQKSPPQPVNSPAIAVELPPSPEPAANTSQRLIIEPADVWLFRDGKPFRGGQDHWAVSLFPPTPLTIQGVIRSKILLDNHQIDPIEYAHNPQNYPDFYQQIGGSGNYGQLCLRGPYLARKENGIWVRYYPAPADLVQNEDKKLYGLKISEQNLKTNWPDKQQQLRPLVLSEVKGKIEPVKGWIRSDKLAEYLKGHIPQADDILSPDQVFRRESRFNIKLERDAYRPAREFLTEVDFVRLCSDIGLDVEIKGVTLNWGQAGYLGIGGEARSGYYQLLNPIAESEPPKPLPQRFKLYFATPTWFERGWQPADWNKWFEGSQPRLVAAAVNRPDRIGGWDIVKGQKPMRAYVPAGSVYYFESDSEVTYTGQPITDDPADGQIGFGQVFIGEWQK